MLKTNLTTKKYRNKLLMYSYVQGIGLIMLASILIYMQYFHGIWTNISYVLSVSIIIFLFLGVKRFFSLFNKYENQNALYQDSFEILVNGSVYIVDLEFNYLYMNKSNIEFMDNYYKIQPKVGENVSKYLTPLHMEVFKENVNAAISLGFKTSEDILKTDGQDIYLYTTYSPVKNSRGEIYAICCVTTDITGSVQEKEKFTELIYQDPLTNIFNRRKVFDYYKIVQQENQKIWVLIFDLDNFKSSNDTFGHATGDQVLVDFSNLLKSTFPSSAIIARWGGDEFLVLVPNITYGSLRVIETTIQNSITYLDELGISVSIGEALAEDTINNNLDYYIDAADLKMYERKRLQKGDYIRNSKVRHQ
ncbi:sensor domain-containing diguanylate cyclase [Weissella soli]|uniref:sensor domain-containing diguanylate cyclase n=1 Tax=Weissella soli TaxID=155866 RepID=UPI0021C19141|nr:sensor domain-containing diguanylate cyclase [Weissella soli]MCT8395178.1 sensor domain-containing diguanylate cyclase [Weissella soli]